MLQYNKVYSKKYPDIALKIIPGHFVTPNSHINYYVDMTTMKTRRSEARAVASAMAQAYISSTIIDTIICMDGTEVIGAYLADELTKAGILSMNQHKTIYVVSPEYDQTGQLIFRDNMLMMVEQKHVLLLLASMTTGKTVNRAISGIEYYGGHVNGVSAIFSAGTSVSGHQINYLFGKSDVPDYISYTPESCKLCQSGTRITAICNGFGYSEVNH
ncbi:orotate phosphoribosyltransferase [Butyrivibrio sp. MC2013]|uniref:orotate phosphoribosyltransferase n=1 Tax=Butyrivibrio sp. MC2013 TaxID=1280686 RepID=UPI00040EAAF7|nr:orotate phosphoribosyltransferase [Butyrivibrio sp. MC2013]